MMMMISMIMAIIKLMHMINNNSIFVFILNNINYLKKI